MMSLSHSPSWFKDLAGGTWQVQSRNSRNGRVASDTFPKHRSRHLPEPWKYTRRPIHAFPKHNVSELREKSSRLSRSSHGKAFHLHSSECSWTVYKRRLELRVLS